MKIAIIYTGTTPQLTELVESNLQAQVGTAAQLASYADPDILAKLREAGRITPQATQKLMDLYWRAADEGADLLYNCCSSVGDIAEAAKPLFALFGVPVVLVDEEMARQATRQYKRIGVVATLPTTLNPTCRLLRRCAGARDIELTGKVVEVFGLAPEPFAEALVGAATSISERVDAILLAQGSMAWVEPRIAEATGLPVLSSPRFGAVGVRRALEANGML